MVDRQKKLSGSSALPNVGAVTLPVLLHKSGPELPLSYLSPQAIKRLEKHPELLVKRLDAKAPAHVREFAQRQSQRQVANEKFRDEIATTGSALPKRRPLADIPLDADADRSREMAKLHRELMISDLSAVIRLIQRSPDIEDDYAMTLGRLMTGLARVQDGHRFYVFEPSDEKDRLPVGDVAAVKRAGIAAAVDCFMRAGDTQQVASEAVAKRMEICEPTDFGFEPGEKITWRQIKDARAEISAGRGKSYQQPIRWRGEDTTPHKVYHAMKAIAFERGEDGAQMAREYGEMLLRGAIERSGGAKKTVEKTDT